MIALLFAVAVQTMTIRVPENRALPHGRQIDLNVVIVPARQKSREALFILQGGPGQAATMLTEFYAKTFEGIRDDRNIVLIDQRGTGKSNGLKCDMGSGPDLFPRQAVEACAKELSSRADFRYYTTAEAVKDLDFVRRKLGYSKINLYGTSYGVRVALEYIRKYPNRVRSVIVKGNVPPQLRYTVDPALDTQRSLERLEARVPGLKEDVEKAMANRPADMHDLFGVEVRNSLHSMPYIAELPAAIHAAANGDWTLFRNAADAHRKALARDLSLGMYFSVTCAEDVWRVGDDEVKRETAATIPGDYWHRQLAGACSVWPHAEPQREVAKPFRANVPALIVSGTFDPVTPPRMGEFTARILPNSRHVVIENASHSFAGLTGCVDVMMSAFVKKPDPKSVDESCARRIGGI